MQGGNQLDATTHTPMSVRLQALLGMFDFRLRYKVFSLPMLDGMERALVLIDTPHYKRIFRQPPVLIIVTNGSIHHSLFGALDVRSSNDEEVVLISPHLGGNAHYTTMNVHSLIAYLGTNKMNRTLTAEFLKHSWNLTVNGFNELLARYGLAPFEWSDISRYEMGTLEIDTDEE